MHLNNGTIAFAFRTNKSSLKGKNMSVSSLEVKYAPQKNGNAVLVYVFIYIQVGKDRDFDGIENKTEISLL